MPGSVTDAFLEQRVKALHKRLATTQLAARGLEATPARLRQSLRWSTVSVVETRVNLRDLRIVTTNDPAFYRLLKQHPQRLLLPGEVLGSQPTLVYGPKETGRRPPRQSIHAEQLGVNDAVHMGGKSGRVASSNPGCGKQCVSLLRDAFPTFRHVNPASTSPDTTPADPSPPNEAPRGTPDRAAGRDSRATGEPETKRRPTATRSPETGGAGRSSGTAPEAFPETTATPSAVDAFDASPPPRGTVPDVRVKLSRTAFRFVRGLAIDFVVSLAIALFVGWVEREVAKQTQARVREAWRDRIYPRLDPIMRSEMRASFEGRQPPHLRKYVGIDWTLVMRELDEDASDIVVWFGKFAAGNPGFGEMYEDLEFDTTFWLLETRKRMEGDRGKRQRDPRADDLVRYPFRTWILVHDPDVLKVIRGLEAEQIAQERSLQQIERTYRALDPSMKHASNIAAIDSAIKSHGYTTASSIARLTIEDLSAAYGPAASPVNVALSRLAAELDGVLVRIVGRTAAWPEDQKRLFDTLFGQQLLAR